MASPPRRSGSAAIVLLRLCSHQVCMGPFEMDSQSDPFISRSCRERSGYGHFVTPAGLATLTSQSNKRRITYFYVIDNN